MYFTIYCACVYVCIVPIGVKFSVRNLNVGDFLWIAKEITSIAPGEILNFFCHSFSLFYLLTFSLFFLHRTLETS